ncbi:MAG: hypothetical protein ACE3JK_03165 [Sporolactobacillus sp.]
MQEYEIFLKEKEQIDRLIEKDYPVISIEENLNGAFVSYRIAENGSSETRIFHILTANGRKYLTNKLLMKNQRVIE